MKTPTVLLLSSCSSIHSPVVFFFSQPAMLASTPVIVYCGLVPMAQSAESVKRKSAMGKGCQSRHTLVPDDGLKSENLLSDSSDTIVNIAVRGSPEPG